MKKILSIAIIIILTPILFVNLVILIDSIVNPDEIPSFFGWKPFIVLSNSMETDINSGDLVVVKELKDEVLKENDVIAFNYDGIVITHRIVQVVNDNGEIKYLTKGDNNSTEDNWYVTKNQIEGLYQYKIPGLGNLAMFIQTPIGIIICLSIPLFLIIIYQITMNIKNKEYYSNEQSREETLKKEIEELKKQNDELKQNIKK